MPDGQGSRSNGGIERGEKMRVSKKRIEDLEKKIAALEKEQLSIKEYVVEAIKSDSEYIHSNI